MLTISWEPAGIAKFARTFTRFTEMVDDLSPLFTALGNDLTTRIIPDQFKTEGGQSGGWQPLDAKYAARKAKEYPGKKILVRTGKLYEALTGGEDSIWKVGKKNAEFGAKTNYGAYHQTGTTKMPARPPLDISEKNRTAWEKLIHRFLVESADGAIADRGAVDAIWSQRMSSGFGEYGVGGKREARGRQEAKSKGRAYGSSRRSASYRGRSYPTGRSR